MPNMNDRQDSEQTSVQDSESESIDCTVVFELRCPDGFVRFYRHVQCAALPRVGDTIDLGPHWRHRRTHYLYRD